MEYAIIVEGKNDRSRLRKLLSEEVAILCTYGTPSEETIERLKREVGSRHVFIFTDNDPPGRRIRAMLAEVFPDAEQMYTKRGYAGVEGTPEEHLIQQLEKMELNEYIRYPQQDEYINAFISLTISSGIVSRGSTG